MATTIGSMVNYNSRILAFFFSNHRMKKHTVLPVNEVCKLMSCCSQKGHGVNAINVVLAEIH